MMTNIIAYLHTTLAYQTAAMHLMVGQANFEAQQLHLNETLPITVPADTNDWDVAMPPDGVTGGFSTSNYLYHFTDGKLILIRKLPQRRVAASTPPPPQGSLIDTNGAYALARQWLAGIGVNVPALESKYPHTSVPYSLRSDGARRPGGNPNHQPKHLRGSPTNNVLNRAASAANPPTFRVTWGGPSPASQPPAQVLLDVLGATKQCTGLHILNPDVLPGPPLRITNAAALLGPPPPPQYFVEQFLGGRAAYNTVAAPDHVVASLLGPEEDTAKHASVAADAGTAAILSRTLTDFNAYSWLDQKDCVQEYVVQLRFTKGAETVDVLWCPECDHVQVTHNGEVAEKDCGAARAGLVRAAQKLFPSEAGIMNLRFPNPNQTK